MSNCILKLNVVHKPKIWGWEDWNLCCHKEGISLIKNKEFEEKNLWKHLRYIKFPILIKNIMAIKNLSIQVHPQNEFAKKIENDNGKSECWYIISAKPDSYIYCGLKEKISYKILEEVLYNGTIEKYIKKIKVNKGDFIYIPSGTIHAIGEGIELLEIQQNSNITYRIYDFERGRELHLNKAVQVIDIQKNLSIKKICNFNYFNNEEFNIEKIIVNNTYISMTKEKLHGIFILYGTGFIENINNNKTMKINSKEMLLVENGVKYKLKGNLQFIKVII